MENLNVEQIIHLREEPIQKLLDQKAGLQAELNSIASRLMEIDDLLQKLGYQAPRDSSSAGIARSGQGRLYEYQAGKGFVLVETGEIIGSGITEAEALQAIKSWCAKVGRKYYPTQWKRIINPDYGKS